MPRKHKNGKNYLMSFTPIKGGKTIVMSTGTDNYEEAKLLELEHRYHAAKNHYENALTVKDLFDKYFQEVAKERNIATSLSSAKNLIEFFKDKPLMILKGGDVRSYVNWRKQQVYRDKPISQATVSKELKLLSAAINYARREWDWEIVNFTASRIPPENNQKDRYLDHEEATKLVEMARKNHRAWYLADLIILAINTGMRKQEMLGLEWNQIDFKRQTITLKAIETKTRRKRYAYLNSAAIRALNNLKSKQSEEIKAVFPIEDPKKSFKTVCNSIGFNDVTLHTLRHTCGTWLALNNFSEIQIAGVLGHAMSSVTARYVHVAADTRKMLELVETISFYPEENNNGN
jgi:integrase